MGIPDITAGSEAAQNVFIAFTAIAVWSSVPLTLRIFVTVKRRRSLYFRALLCCSWGLSVRGIGYMLQFLSPTTPWIASVTISQIGWVFMVSGFATVLWSRLGFIMENDRIRRYLLWMIIANGLVWHSTMTIISYAINAYRKDPSSESKEALARWTRPQMICERIQIVFFCGQEILISSLYCFAAYQYLYTRGCFDTHRKKVRDVMFLLLATQTVVILIDVGLITIDFLGLLRLKGFLHSFIYCVKLEFEFVVLNQLVEISRLGLPSVQLALGPVLGVEDGLGVPERDSTRWSGITLRLPADEKLPSSTHCSIAPNTAQPSCVEHGLNQPNNGQVQIACHIDNT